MDNCGEISSFENIHTDNSYFLISNHGEENSIEKVKEELICFENENKLEPKKMFHK